MGNSQSGASAANVASHGNAHSPIPQDPVPFTGPQHEHRVMIVRAKLKASFSGTTVSDVNEYMATLAQQYAEYYKLDTFFRIPYDQKMSGFTSVMLSYQAIFSRPSHYVPSPESWQLQVVPTQMTMSAQMSGLLMRHGGNVDASMNNIYNVLAQQSNRGGRLICLECNGQRNAQGWTSANFGVNLFFNVPQHPNPTIYTNLAFCVPMQVSYMGIGGNINVHMDINGVLAMHLNQGWKLIDIIIPQHESGITQQQMSNNHHGYMPSQLSTIWFFEKEQQRVNANDMTPLYQVTVVDVYLPVSVGFGSAQAQCHLQPLLTEMGNRGWNLVCILDTPRMERSGMMGVTVFMQAFFQRPLVGGGGGVGYALPPQQPPAPGYAAPPAQGYAPQVPPPAGFNVGGAPPPYAPGAPPPPGQ